MRRLQNRWNYTCFYKKYRSKQWEIIFPLAMVTTIWQHCLASRGCRQIRQCLNALVGCACCVPVLRHFVRLDRLLLHWSENITSTFFYLPQFLQFPLMSLLTEYVSYTLGNSCLISTTQSLFRTCSKPTLHIVTDDVTLVDYFHSVMYLLRHWYLFISYLFSSCLFFAYIYRYVIYLISAHLCERSISNYLTSDTSLLSDISICNSYPYLGL